MKMLIASSTILALCFGLPIAQQRQGNPSSGTARIHGRVVAGDTGAPVRGASVTLSGPMSGAWVAVTDEDGRFDIRELPAGRFSLRIAKATFVPTYFGLTSVSSTNFDVRDGEQIDRGELRLPRGGVISGKIFDAFGDPVAEASVAAWRADYSQAGPRRLASAGSAQTNDLGDFRLFGLRPGKYYVSASFRGMQISATEGGAAATQFIGARMGFAPTFYPGTSQAAQAQQVIVTAAQETPGTGIRLLSVPLVRVSGTIIESSTRPASGFVVMLNPVRSDGAPFLNANLVEPDAQGRFSFSNVAPGEYRIDALPRARLEAIGRTGGAGVGRSQTWEEFASELVSVSGQPVDGLVVQIGKGVAVSGKVTVDGVSPAPSLASQLRVDVLPVLGGQGMSGPLLSAAGAVDATGAFVVRGAAIPCLIRVGGVPFGTFLRAVIARGADVADGGLDLSQGSVEGVEIALTTKPTKVAGSITAGTSTAAGNSTVIVYAEDRDLWSLPMNRRVVRVASDADGRFLVTGLPAGRYRAIALGSSIEIDQWADPDHLEQLRGAATPFTLADGETKALTLVQR